MSLLEENLGIQTEEGKIGEDPINVQPKIRKSDKLLSENIEKSTEKAKTQRKNSKIVTCREDEFDDPYKDYY